MRVLWNSQIFKKMDDQMSTVRNKTASWWLSMMKSLRKLKNKFVKIASSLYHNFLILKMSSNFLQFCTWLLQKNLAIRNCALIGSQNCFRNITNYNRWRCSNLLFVLQCWRRIISGQDCYQRWDLGYMCEHWDDKPVNEVGSRTCIQESAKNFVNHKSYGNYFMA